MTNDSNHRRHRASATEDDDEAAEETRQRHVKVPTRYLHALTSHRNPLPIHLLMAGWNRLESVPRWMIERTLGFVVPVVSLHHHHHHNHNHHHSSSMVRRVLEQSDNSELDMEALKQKYAKEIKADSELQDMQKRIRAMKQQLQQQRAQRERQEKKQAAWREKEQKQLEHATTKLHHALEQLLLGKSARSTTRDYSKAISRAGNRGKAKRVNSGSNSHHHHHGGSSSGSSSYVKTVSKAAVAAATTPIALASSAVTTVTTTAAATISSTSTEQLNKLTPEQRECLELETTILRHMHQTMIFQNQCDIAEASSKQVTSALKRERALLDTQQAQVAMMQMVLDGTQRALHDIYPEVVLRQESILERVILAAASSSSSSSEEGETAMLTAIPRLIAPSFQQEGGAVFVPSSSFRLSNRTMDGISDLGESVKDDPLTMMPAAAWERTAFTTTPLDVNP